MLLRTQFIEKLEQQYGTWERSTSRFGKATFGEISKDLCISASQFSKLIYESASEASYERAIRNVQRLVEAEHAKVEKQKLIEDYNKHNLQINAKIENLQKRLSRSRLRTLLYLLLIFISLLIVFWIYQNLNTPSEPNFRINRHPLQTYFDSPSDLYYNSPYLKSTEVQDYCPASAYEGTWILDQPYKFPLPGYKPGVYYLGRSADIKMRYSRSYNLDDKKQTLTSYEYLVSEIWVDMEQEPFSSTYFNKSTKTYTSTFKNLRFENQSRFKKVADIYTFFISTFQIYDSTVTRRGEPAGRFITDIDQDLVQTYDIDLNYILKNVLDNFKKTNCNDAKHTFCDPNNLEEGESTLSFNCFFTIESENLGMGGGYPYTKTYKLIKQNYSDNLTCSCDK